MTAILSGKTKISLFSCACLVALSCAVTDARAASLFGDFSCKDWSDLEHKRKKSWVNAFLAPLSLTLQGLKRAEQDPYNDDPNAVDPAISSIDKFCISHPQQGASDGAAAYLARLTSN